MRRGWGDAGEAAAAGGLGDAESGGGWGADGATVRRREDMPDAARVLQAMGGG